MTVRSTLVWKQALELMTVRLVLAQLGLAAGVMGFFVLWLRLPDASVLEVASSALLAVVVVIAAELGEGRLLLGLAGRPATLGRLLRGTLPLLAGVALWFAWSAWLAHLSGHSWMLAAYLNSRAPHRLRNLLSFAHIQLWLEWMWTGLQWMGAGFIAALVFALMAASRPLRAVVGILRSPSFWFLPIFGCPAATFFTGALMAWLPLKGLWPEMVSLGLRLTLAAFFNGAVACWLLAVLAVCLRRAEAGYAAPAGGPEDSHSRTAEAP